MRLTPEIFFKHLDEIVSISKESFTDPWSKEAFESLVLSKNSSNYFFGEFNNEGEIIAYLIFSIAGDEGELLDIAVKKSERGKGIGQHLLEEAFLIAKQHDVSSIFLEVRKSNYIAINLYEKLGFMISGIRKKYYENPEEDAFLMKKIISPEIP